MDLSYNIGKVVYSKNGRDSGKYFIVIGILDENYVYISDGDLRAVEKPKKKKIRHISFTNVIADDIRESILSGKKINNSIVRKFLQSYDLNKEV